MKKILSLTTFWLLMHLAASAQVSDIHASLEVQGIETTNGVVPFWLRSNQYGSVPLPGGSGSFIGRVRKDYDTTRRVFDWAASFEGRVNVGNRSQFDLIEGFVKGKAGIFELKAGRSKDIIGLTDSTLSTGSFPISGNALGIPQISLSIPNYYSIPVLGKLFAVKGAYVNGYMGNVIVRSGKRTGNYTNYFLSNSLYLKVGMPSWRFKFEAGYNHQALWGDEKLIFPKFNLSGSETYWYVLTGRLYQGSKVGNHLGSVDVGAEYRFDGLTLSVYRQSLYDKGALSKLANIKDGLNGISLVNNQPGTGDFQWKKVILELFYTVNQAGTLSSKSTQSGAEDYYNNYEYVEGWSYKNEALGNPFITTALDARSNLGRAQDQFFINNRVKVFHAATQFYAFKWLYTAKFSYSMNYGTYDTGSSKYIGVGGIRNPSNPGAFSEVNQFSAYLEGLRSLKHGYTVGYDVGYDRGGLLYNSFGVILKVSKSFL
ncbi:capsule assembly Wzi family protein [Mucilaginibacter sp. FT3.2]|uniref:capsule assembly Wzi family protein n=1 Tax=Mucilaginibacter sp. FT3.2 TaxID=2723090 RepID=UPI00161CA990|nr:capsule assembly Wzi family protein [Mucilaginibacter sp. FT3.2]MBB6231877.1 hypothetical protein [Mucilaginibacter sp. FT3.2]